MQKYFKSSKNLNTEILIKVQKNAFENTEVFIQVQQKISIKMHKSLFKSRQFQKILRDLKRAYYFVTLSQSYSFTAVFTQIYRNGGKIYIQNCVIDCLLTSSAEIFFIKKVVLSLLITINLVLYFRAMPVSFRRNPRRMNQWRSASQDPLITLVSFHLTKVVKSLTSNKLYSAHSLLNNHTHHNQGCYE